MLPLTACRYLVQRVLPMLPRLLCEQLCSLQPGDPKFAFSIVWEVDADGHIYREWAGRSIINSCAKLAYPMVQQMIEGCFDPGTWQVKLFHGVSWEQVRVRRWCCWIFLVPSATDD
jgi:DIS3-like exonuclease 2